MNLSPKLILKDAQDHADTMQSCVVIAVNKDGQLQILSSQIDYAHMALMAMSFTALVQKKITGEA